MPTSNNVNIKLEVIKDKTTGELLITAYFRSNAPNILKEKDSYYWFPTIEEKNLINDAFDLFSSNFSNIKPIQQNIQPEIKRQEPQVQMRREIPVQQPQIIIKKPIQPPPVQRREEPAIFEVTKEEGNYEDSKKSIEKRIDQMVYRKPKEEKREEQNIDDIEIEKETEEDIIVEADEDAIEAAIKKHTQRDRTIVEVDEQTIIDKVLSQKKKGKWAKK